MDTTMNQKEFLVTGQGYAKKDPYKQTVILHDTFFSSDETDARNKFENEFESQYNILTIYSAIDLTKESI